MQSENAVLVIIVIVETFAIACHLIALQTKNLSPSKKHQAMKCTQLIGTHFQTHSELIPHQFLAQG
jgi:hypothetical protein